MLRVLKKGGEKEMQNINNKLSVEELVHSYDDKISKTDLTIFIGSDRTNCSSEHRRDPLSGPERAARC